MTTDQPPAEGPELYIPLRWLGDLLQSLMPKIPKDRKRLRHEELMAANAILDTWNGCKLAAKPIEQL